MLVGLLGRELALAHELLDERVVVGQALEAAVAQAVRAAVADVGDRELVLADVGGGDASCPCRRSASSDCDSAWIRALASRTSDAQALLDAARCRRAGRPAKTSTAVPEATSPACAPPMPSATTNSGERAK